MDEDDTPKTRFLTKQNNGEGQLLGTELRSIQQVSSSEDSRIATPAHDKQAPFVQSPYKQTSDLADRSMASPASHGSEMKIKPKREGVGSPAEYDDGTPAFTRGDSNGERAGKSNYGSFNRDLNDRNISGLSGKNARNDGHKGSAQDMFADEFTLMDAFTPGTLDKKRGMNNTTQAINGRRLPALNQQVS